MKQFITNMAVLFFSSLYSQNSTIEIYEKADSLFQAGNSLEAFPLYKKLEEKIESNDTLYKYILWYYTQCTSNLEAANRSSENWNESLMYGQIAISLIEKGKSYFNEDFAVREYWMYKNLTVSCFGLNKIKEANEYRKLLYTAHSKGNLPDGIHEYFNFEFFKLDDKNVWGYEWFAELPKDRYSSSFSKIVYYVYSTNPDGSDKEQLYRLHVLMYHGDNKNFDYVMDKRLETATEEIGGTLYSYTYKEDIDLAKLRTDVREIVNTSPQPDTERKLIKKKAK